MDLQSPFSKDQVDNLNSFQSSRIFHPYTCGNDGDFNHIMYEFRSLYGDRNYEEYIIEEKNKGVPFPEAQFTETKLIATEGGWICPVCDYKQNWAHDFSASKKWDI